MRLNKLYLLVFSCLWQAGLACANPMLIDLELSAAHDDNVSRAESGRDIKPDNSLGLELKASRSLMLTPNSGMLVSGGVRLTEHAHYDDLSNLSANLTAAYRIQPVVGYSAPWLELGGMLQRLYFRHSDIRDGTLLETHMTVGKRFTDRIRLQGSLGWEQRWADASDVYELSRRRLFLLADYKLSPTAALYGSLSRDFGDQAVTSSPAPQLGRSARAIADDPAFGDRRAYRLDAIADIYGLGASIALNAGSTLDLGVQHFRISADGGHAYAGTELRASWLYRFR